MAPRHRTSRTERLTPLLAIWAVFAVAMYIPAIHALVLDDYRTSRAFFYTGTMGLVLVALLELARGSRQPRHGTLGQLLALLATFTLIPVFLAVPVHDALRTTSFFNAYFDMVSAITTTGADIYDDPGRLPPSLHLWRAEVAWLGGLLMWIAASAILAPLSLGGFEVTARGQPGHSVVLPGVSERADARRRLLSVTRTLVPVYGGLTLVLWILQVTLGETALVGLSHAMSVMATSGISPIGGTEMASAGIAGEFVLFLFMFFALSRMTFSGDTSTRGYARLDRDPEFRIGVLIVLGVPLLLFLRHWLGAFEVTDTAEITAQALRAFWGSMFTVMSYLTTTGFVSADWATAQHWSGLGTPGLILLGLAVMGGGVATTAGGVKLLRVYALYLNGLREMDQLIHPSAVSGESDRAQRIQRGGAFIAWISFMMFALSLALITVVLTAMGTGFEDALVLSIASLSTTGPLIETASETTIRLTELGAPAKTVLMAAMVIGRLEILAIVALLTPDLWRGR